LLTCCQVASNFSCGSQPFHDLSETATRSTSAAFQRGYLASCNLSSRFTRCLSAAGIRFLDHPVPAEEFRLPCGWPTASTFLALVSSLTQATFYESFAEVSPDRLHRDYHVSLCENRTGWMPSLLRSQWCPSMSLSWSHAIRTRRARPCAYDSKCP